MNFAAFTGGLAVGFALLLMRRDLLERLFSSLASASQQARDALGAGGAGGAGSACTTVCTGCEPKVISLQEQSQVPFAWKPPFKGVVANILPPGTGTPEGPRR